MLVPTEISPEVNQDDLVYIVQANSNGYDCLTGWNRHFKSDNRFVGDIMRITPNIRFPFLMYQGDCPEFELVRRDGDRFDSKNLGRMAFNRDDQYCAFELSGLFRGYHVDLRQGERVNVLIDICDVQDFSLEKIYGLLESQGGHILERHKIERRVWRSSRGRRMGREDPRRY
ncbi:MAG: hypothetical protein ABII01_04455 [Candidatus Woesearchaeota archaeon]